MEIKNKFTILEFFAGKKIIIKDLNKLSLEELFGFSIYNHTLISELKNNSSKKYHFAINNTIFNKNSEKEVCVLSNKIEFINLIILVSAIFSILFKREELNNEHHLIFQNILKDETFYHIELQDSDNSFFKDFIINRHHHQTNIELSNFSKFLKFTFYHFEQELEEMESQKINLLLNKITNYRLYIREIYLN